MNKLDYHSLTKEQREEVEQQQQQHSHRAIISMQQVEEVKKELIDSGFIEGQDFRVEGHEIITGTSSISFWIKKDDEKRQLEHEYEYNYYGGSIQLLWKDITQTFDFEEDQSYVTPDNPLGWKICERKEGLKLASKRMSWRDYNYHGKYGRYSTPLTIHGSREFCKNYRDLKATNYLKRMREATKNAPELLEHELESQKLNRLRKQKITKAKEILTSQLEDIFLSKIKLSFNSYNFKLDILFPEGDSDYHGDNIYIEYDPERNYECSITKVVSAHGFIPWDKVALIEQLQTEQVEA